MSVGLKSKEKKFQEGVAIAKASEWMVLEPAMMPHLIKNHEKLGRTLTEEDTVMSLSSLGFQINQATR